MNTEKPLVSVLVPVYNVEEYLAESLDSVVGQTYRQLEIIVIDDGSTDCTGQIADEYAEKDSRIKVIHQKNAGVPFARNAGLEVATGDFITFLDGDDWFAPDLIETQLETIKKWDADIAVCGVELVYRNTRLREDGKSPCNFIEDYEEKKDLLLSQGKWRNSPFNGGFTQKKLIKKECLIETGTNNKIRFVSNRAYLDDEFFTLQVYKKSKRVAFNKKAVFFYRQRKTSLVHATNFSFRMLRIRNLMGKTNLISAKDLLLSNTQSLFAIKYIDPNLLNEAEKDLFYKTIQWCREHLLKIIQQDISFKMRIFLIAYLVKWAPLSVRQKILSFIQPLFAPPEPKQKRNYSNNQRLIWNFANANKSNFL